MICRRCVGTYLPELHTPEREGRVIYIRLDALEQAPVAIPVHNTMVPDVDMAEITHWFQMLGF